MAQDMIYLGEYSMGVKKKKVYSIVVGWNVLYVATRFCPSNTIVQTFYIPTDFLLDLPVARR